MKFTFLGTGTSQGVPVIACKCVVCSSRDLKDKRLRTSLLVESDKTKFVIDSGPDFRQQMLREKVESLQAILFTHAHKDHTAGLDDIRAYNFVTQHAMDVYASEYVQESLKREFFYIFHGPEYPGLPQLNFKNIVDEPFSIGEIEIIPFEVLHHKLPVKGFRIQDFTYITDANFISDKSFEKIKGTKVLVLNALRTEKHISHFNLTEAIEVAKRVGANETYFTHISHQLGLHSSVEQMLPTGMHLAYDGLKIELTS